MSVFISYSHKDKEFANRLATNLMTRKVRVWVDTWELRAGDSLISRIQDAIQSSSALVVLVSQNSLASTWCTKELNSGLLRELEERRVVVVPALVEECELPLFLREKKYADFRSSFDDGLSDVMEAIASVTAEAQGRIERPDFHTDWSVDWGGDDQGRYRLILTLLEHGENVPFSTLTEVSVVANKEASRRQQQYEAAGIDWWGRRMILELLADSVLNNSLQVVLEDQHVVVSEVTIRDPKQGYKYALQVRSRRLGEDTGKSIFLDIGSQLQQICSTSAERVRKPTQGELAAILKLLPDEKPME